MCYYILPLQSNTGETILLSRSTVCNLTEENFYDSKVKKEMAALDQSIKNHLGNASHKEGEADKNYVPEGVIIEEPKMYKDLADTDPANDKSIEEEALMMDIEYFDSQTLMISIYRRQ